MRKLIISILLFTLVNTSFAERKILDVIGNKITPGKSKIYILKKNGKGFDVTTKMDEVSYDKSAGLYQYILWKTDGTKVELLHELANKVNVNIKCLFTHDHNTNQYIYKYIVQNKSSSIQSLNTIAIDMNPSFVTYEEKPKSWHYFSKGKHLRGTPLWVFWGSLGTDIHPGKEGIFIVESNFGPIISNIYASGRPKKYPHPLKHEKEQFARHPPNKEGVKGKTITPGKLNVTKENVNKYIEEIMQESLEWGWISQIDYNSLIPIIMDEKDFREFLIKFRIMADSIQPELRALVNHVERVLNE